MSTSNMDFKHRLLLFRRLIMHIYLADFLLLLQVCQLAWVFLEFTKQCRKLHLQLESELKGKGYLTVWYSGTSIWESAKRLAKFVRYNKVLLYWGSFSCFTVAGGEENCLLYRGLESWKNFVIRRFHFTATWKKNITDIYNFICHVN